MGLHERRLINWLGGGSWNRALLYAIPIPLLVWYTFLNPFNFSQCYIIIFLYLLFASYVPPTINGVVGTWLLLTPISIINILFVTMYFSMMQKMVEDKYSSTKISLVMIALYNVVSLVTSMTRVSLKNREMFIACLSITYITDIVVMMMFSLISDGVTVSVTNRLVLTFLQQPEAFWNKLQESGLGAVVPWLKSIMPSILSCENIFSPDGTLIPNQHCDVPVPVPMLNGLLNNVKQLALRSTEEGLTITAKPTLDFIWGMWTASGQYGTIKALLLNAFIAMGCFTVLTLVRRRSNMRPFAVQELLRIHRKLYLESPNILQQWGLVTHAELIEHRVINSKVTTPFSASLVQDNGSNHNLDILHMKIPALQASLNASRVEDFMTLPFGSPDATKLIYLADCISYQMAIISIFARASSAEHLHNSVRSETSFGTKESEFLKDVYWTSFEVDELLDEVLLLDNVQSCDSRTEVLLSLSEKLQALKKNLMIMDLEFDRMVNKPLATELYRKAYCLSNIRKIDSLVDYCEAASERTFGNGVKSIITMIIGPIFEFSRNLGFQWSNTVKTVFGQNIKPKEPVMKISIRTLETFLPRTYTDNWFCRKRKIPFTENAEVWGYIRYVIGHCTLFAVLLLNENVRNMTWLSATRKKHESLSALETPNTATFSIDNGMVIFPDNAWVDVPLVNYTKQSQWFLVSFYCSYLITYQGTVKRACLRFINITICSLSAWACLYVFPSNLYGLTIWLTVHFILSTVIFTHPANGELGFDTIWGYSGQLLACQVALLTTAARFDGKIQRDEIIINRIFGHIIGTSVALFLSLILFPSDANRQISLRLGNACDCLSSREVILLELCSCNVTTVSTEELNVWTDYYQTETTNLVHELAHAKKIVEDNTICDTFPLFKNDSALIEVFALVSQATLLQTAYAWELSYYRNRQEELELLWNDEVDGMLWAGKAFEKNRDVTSMSIRKKIPCQRRVKASVVSNSTNGTMVCQGLVEGVHTMSQLWLALEYCLTNVGTRNFDLNVWILNFITSINSIRTSWSSHLTNCQSLVTESTHALITLWLSELCILVRVAEIIGEKKNRSNSANRQ